MANYNKLLTINHLIKEAKKQALRVTKFDGKKARIVGRNHPHHTAEAICMGADKTTVGWGLVFQDVSDESVTFFVFEPTDLKWL